MDNINEFMERIDNLRRQKVRGQYAPHKPLLLLYALGQLNQGNISLHYSDVETALTSLLRDFGPQRVKHHPEAPFLRLENDGLWVVKIEDSLAMRKSNDQLKISQLKNAVGELTSNAIRVLQSDPKNIGLVARRLLETNFSRSIHQDILDTIGLTLEESSERTKRSPNFRRKVLRAYEYECCICGYNMRLGDKLAGVEAAHIMWHEVGGPDVENNGLALCVFHHKIFDLGAFTIDDDGRTICCSEELSGSSGLDLILRFHGRKLKQPQSIRYIPDNKYFEWHRETIFKGPKRDL